MEDPPLVRVMALHALFYCERLFYLEEVEELRLADRNVWAGRRLHLSIDPGDEAVEYTLASSKLGIQGKFDAVRKKSGELVPVEHKRGGSCKTGPGSGAWPSDEIQALAYALLLQEHSGQPVLEAQVFYHRDRRLVRIPVTEESRLRVADAVKRALTLRQEVTRPPVTPKEILCRTCSLAPICLPEEQRYYDHRQKQLPLRLFPEDSERRTLHVISPRARIGRQGEALVVTQDDGSRELFGTRMVEDLVLHGQPQISTQALRLCAYQRLPVHWVTTEVVPGSETTR